MKLQTAIAYPSACSFAMFLGEISPKINTTTVETAVETAAAKDSQLPSFNKSTNNNVAKEDSKMLTMLFPISTVLIKVSYFLYVQKIIRRIELLMNKNTA